MIVKQVLIPWNLSGEYSHKKNIISVRFIMQNKIQNPASQSRSN